MAMSLPEIDRHQDPLKRTAITFGKIWKQITSTRLDPETETGHRAGLLSGLLFILILLGTIGELEWLRRQGGFTLFDFFTIGAILYLGLVFMLNKRGFFQFAVFTTIGIMAAGIYAIFWLGDSSSDSNAVLFYLILPVLLAEFFLSLWGYALVIIPMLTAMLLLSPTGTVLDTFVLLTIFAVLLSVFKNNQRKLDQKSTAKLEQSHKDLMSAYDATIAGWSAAMDLRDRETLGHSSRVAEFTLRLSRIMGLKGEDLIHAHRGALLHDIGKLGIPDSILHKPGPLTDAEWELMRRHPDFAMNMLSPISYLECALEIPYCHHERWDGSGYPRGLKGEHIPLAARIFAVVDVWDALTSDRPYRGAWKYTEALDYIRSQSGKQFDPQVVRAFLAIVQVHA